MSNAMETPEDIKRAYKHAEWFKWLAALMGLLIVLLALISSLSDRNDSRSARSETAALREQLAAQADQLRQQLVTQQQKSACETVFTRAVAKASQDNQDAMASLLLAGFNTPPSPSTARLEAVAEALDDIQSTHDAFNDASARRDAYVLAGDPLPCPVKPPQPDPEESGNG